MDGITSIGGDTVEADAWGVDVALVGSQKCLAAPAGLSAISVSNLAWERYTKNPPYYLDLAAYRKSAGSTPMETPYTPAVPLFLALREACLIIDEEGLNNRVLRHKRLSQAVRAAAEAWGLALFPKVDDLHSVFKHGDRDRYSGIDKRQRSPWNGKENGDRDGRRAGPPER